MVSVIRTAADASLVGLLSVLVGSLVGWVVGRLFPSGLDPEKCKWNNMGQMELSLFATGFSVYLLLEAGRRGEASKK